MIAIAATWIWIHVLWKQTIVSLIVFVLIGNHRGNAV